MPHFLFFDNSKWGKWGTRIQSRFIEVPHFGRRAPQRKQGVGQEKCGQLIV